MFPFVLPGPLSKKWGAKLAWAKKKIEHVDTHTSEGQPRTSMVPSLAPVLGRRALPSPSLAHGGTRLGSGKEGPFSSSTHEPRTIWGA